MNGGRLTSDADVRNQSCAGPGAERQERTSSNIISYHREQAYRVARDDDTFRFQASTFQDSPSPPSSLYVFVNAALRRPCFNYRCAADVSTTLLDFSIHVRCGSTILRQQAYPFLTCVPSRSIMRWRATRPTTIRNGNPAVLFQIAAALPLVTDRSTR